MAVKILFLFLSVALFYIDIFLVFGIWFRGKRNTYLKTFFALGLIISTWALFNGLGVLLSEEIYQQIYPYYFILGCVMGPLFSFYVLHFTQSKFARSRAVAIVLGVLVAVDILALITNPWHKGFIAGFEGLLPIGGVWAPVHFAISYVPLFLSLILLFHYIFKNAKTTPLLLVVGFSVLLPIISNILYTFKILSPGFDLTPFLFLVMFITFSVYSARFRLFDNRNAAFTNLFNTFSEALLIADVSGSIADANPSFYKAFPDFTLAFDKTTVKDIESYFEAVAVEQNPKDIIKRLDASAEEISNAEITLLLDGKPCYYVLSKTGIYQKTQHVGFIITLIDVSNNQRTRQMIEEIKQNNSRLQEMKNFAENASKAKSDFLASMSHEIRTPLNAIIGMTSIGASAADPEQIKYCFTKTADASKHLLGVISDILDMSKIESGKFELSAAEFNFESMLRQAVGVINFRIDEKKQKFDMQIDQDIPKNLIGDDQRLAQVITNLLSNAVKFTSEHGSIGLITRLIEKENEFCVIQISVADTGIGINSEQQARLFQAFQQAESNTTRKFGGTGLGLSISKSIIDLMGGQIWVESELGKGSTFSFTVKVKQGEGKNHGVSVSNINIKNEDVPNDIGMFAGRGVLLVEDIEINREIVLTLLEPTRLRIDCAVNGAEAVRMFNEAPEKYEMILMDVQMPEMDGYEATRLIRASDASNAKTIPIVAMTANVFKEDVEKCIRSGMNGHIGKPIDINALSEKLRMYLLPSADS
ncbi:MAG: ATP-binding protein [Firmicutes bacterium]|nr:ATP-binding protein [Bacillota bacterium]